MLHLEEKIAHLEHHVTQQDKVILELAEDIARLKRDLKALRERSGGPLGGPGGGEDGDTPLDERPPHY